MPIINYFIIASLVQAIGMLVDEFYFHYKRSLPRWERLGHPLDTITVIIIFIILAITDPLFETPPILFVMIIFSCLFITKDEWVHQEHCSGGELWLHALLFVVHPIVLFLAWASWKESGFSVPHQIQLTMLIVFLLYQVIYWNLIKSEKSKINNEFYNDLGEEWYHSKDDSVALLRAEAKVKNPWVAKMIHQHYPEQELKKLKLLDVGCGAGLLTNDLALSGIQVTGIDLSESSLEMAEKYDTSKTVKYIKANAYQLPFEDKSFDVVTSMDFLEHVEEPLKVVNEISRVLKPGGLFIFHTFNRNLLAHLVIIKGMEWLVKDVPRNLHVIELFVKPSEMKKYCLQSGMSEPLFTGIAPKIMSLTFLKLLLLRKVDPHFGFQLQKSTVVAYLGTTKKNLV